MSQQILIIGLGHFGMSLAQTLSERGAEVLATDINRDLVEEASTFVTDAVVIDATDETELASLEPGKRDLAVCAIGDDSKEASIICTALLRQMGAPVVVSRANDKIHQRILQLVGAHQVINPEHEFGKRFALRLLYRDVVVDTRLSEDLVLTEIHVQPFMIGKTLLELGLPKQFGVLVAGIRRGSPAKVIPPSPNHPLQADDILIIVSPEASIAKLTKAGRR